MNDFWFTRNGAELKNAIVQIAKALDEDHTKKKQQTNYIGDYESLSAELDQLIADGFHIDMAIRTEGGNVIVYS